MHKSMVTECSMHKTMAAMCIVHKGSVCSSMVRSVLNAQQFGASRKGKLMKQKANNRRAELVFILDRSGSMGGLEKDTVGGYNAMMEKQREAGGDITVTTVLFDDRYELLHDRVKLDELRPMTEDEYYVRGSTALIDAIGKNRGIIGRNKAL